MSIAGFWVNLAFWSLILLTLFFGFVGWSAQATTLNLTFGDILYRTLMALFLSGPYDSAGEWNGNPNLNAARFCGLAVVIIAASKAATALLSTQWERVKARLRDGHLILIGDGALIDKIEQIALSRGETVHRFCARKESIGPDRAGRFVLPGSWDIDQAKVYGLAAARSVTISMADEAATIAIARSIREEIPEQQMPIQINVKSPWLVRRIGEQEQVIGVSLFSEARLAVRRIQRRHPPFLIAKKAEHARLHIVVVGFGQHGEAVLVETLLSCLTTYLDKPLLTIIDPNIDSLTSDLKLRYPEIDKSIEVKTMRGSLQGGSDAISECELLKTGRINPITVVYVCLPDESLALAAGLALQGIGLRHTWVAGPIFIRLSTSGAIIPATPGVSELTATQLLGFGETEEVVLELGMFQEIVDKLARAFHDGYRRVVASGAEADLPWEQLSEDMRDSNRRLVLHMPAIVSCAGYDLEPWLQQIHDSSQTPELPNAGALLINPDILESLARLEHERWMADRRINGWSHHKIRDNTRRLHPDLIPFEDLSAQSQSYDREMVRTLARCLTTHAGAAGIT